MGRRQWEIRTLTEKDVNEYSLLWMESRRLNPDIFADAAGDDIQKVRADIRRAMKKKTGKVIFGCEVRGEIIGVGEFEREARLNRRHRAKIGGLHVKESKRGNGIGTSLFETMIRYARGQAGLEQVEVGITGDPSRRGHGVDGSTEHQIEFCKKRGFQLYVRHPAWMRVGDRYLDAYFMGLDLFAPPPPEPGKKPKKSRKQDESQNHSDLILSVSYPKQKIVLPNPGVIMRLANKDAKDYQWMRAESRRLHPDIFADSYVEEKRKSLDEIRDEMRRKIVYAYLLDQEMIGIAEFYCDADENKQHRGHLAGMYVKEGIRGRILGKPPGLLSTVRPARPGKGRPVGQKHMNEDLRGKTCAAALVDEVIRTAEQTEGVRQLELGVVAANASAIKLYHNKGFRSIGAHPNWMKINGDNIHVHFMVMPIGEGREERSEVDSRLDDEE